jgi:hypothetical protein
MILQLLIAWLATKIHHHQEQVIRYLREENRILKAKLKGKRIQLTDTERRRLAVLAHPIARKQLTDVSTIATPDTLRRWYRRLVVQSPSPTPRGKLLGRPRVATEIEQLVIRMATENPRWGYRRIQGALANLGYRIDNTTVRNILRRNYIDPAPIRGRASMSWSQFITLHWDVLEASGFFVDLRSAVSNMWTVALTRNRSLYCQIVHLARGMRHSAMSVLPCVTRQDHDRWAGLLAVCAPPAASVCGRPEWVSADVLPPPCLGLLQPVDHPLQARQLQQEPSPPGARQLDRALHCSHPTYGRGAFTHRLPAVPTVSMVERKSNRVVDHKQRTTASNSWYAVAA